ncbi:MAG: hypothetical protein B6D72_06320 [gamma proteobacterium symbiont of Ctena orbiculata]|uniref:GNAT family N-acetyltransferase n=1 Tax=Candidatus Thiodiazotropha taylori TaxID=2792791 RepID=A0A944MFI2_9GAMM|nr:GNAT family N-acetyltransferase [Candidatus Thiodiazotropha taylori]PUB89231.1 MAG: N-acetyltransferase [gamma proteobacterium symbiont of Ctena orbiculata]MBT2990462.1 GNAT family N-acetyltransferase [Candidatus Thiodiazotropha taylori]MBT2998437.1 GNAT family N-acetyltransferase [Candidatus Thiodiazotropha taylori]MBT3002663.1 GNAT family N-acetyltransferase [Candidatus Thiodiazotropha taylori]
MKDGTPYQMHMCVAGRGHGDQQQMKEQIANAVECMSSQSRWLRFAAPIIKLSDRQLSYLTDFDNSDRVAWCATIHTPEGDRGIGLARYTRLEDEDGIAEFAVTVVDEFQGQGIGFTLLKRLVETAGANQITVLRGYILPSNKGMLELCKKFGAVVGREDSSTLVADIQLTKQDATV